jgi:hypothetical protein
LQIYDTIVRGPLTDPFVVPISQEKKPKGKPATKKVAANTEQTAANTEQTQAGDDDFEFVAPPPKKKAKSKAAAAKKG